MNNKTSSIHYNGQKHSCSSASIRPGVPPKNRRSRRLLLHSSLEASVVSSAAGFLCKMPCQIIAMMSELFTLQQCSPCFFVLSADPTPSLPSNSIAAENYRA